MLNRKTVCTVGGMLLVGAALQAQASRPSLTAQDYAEIQQLNAYWIHGSDTGDANIRMRAFAPGGELVQPAGLGGCQGSTTDCRAVQRPLDHVIPNTPAIPEVPYIKLPGCRVSKTPGCIRQHFITDTLIEATAEGARSLSHLLITEKDPGKQPLLTEDSGAYVDTYVKGRDGRWGIKTKMWVPFTEKGNPFQRSAGSVPAR
jgi:hypothetical protein